MSKEAAAAFVEHLKDNPDARVALMNNIRDAAQESTLTHGAELGHDFTGPELVEAYKNHLKGQGLSDDDIADLASSSGGAPHVVYAAKDEASGPTKPQPYTEKHHYGSSTSYGDSHWYD